jgi:anti-sigma28 factor (negative regulator of flagellin synthesis)
MDLSDLTGLARALLAEDPARAARVEQLAQEYRAGAYQVDLVAVSRALIREAAAELSSAGAEG